MKNTHKCLTFQWEGTNPLGQTAEGLIEAPNLTIAKALIQQQGITIKQLSKVSKSPFNRKNRSIKSIDLALFSRQMATLIEAGIPLLQSLTIVSKGQTIYKMQMLIENIRQAIVSGSTFADALQKHPQYFNTLYCNLIRAGEQSGSLEQMLRKVATYKEKIERIKKKIKKAMTYPAIIMLIAFFVAGGLLFYVVPQFELLFENFNAELPALTRTVILLSDGLLNYGYLLFGLIGGGIYGIIYALKRSTKLAHLKDKYILRFPIIGPLLKKTAIARFARTLSITFTAGLPLLDALNAVAHATGNRVYAKATLQIKKDIANGQQLYLSLDNTKLFPNMAIQLIKMGETSGTLEKMLSKVADFYEEAVDNTIETFSHLLEPLIMAILGIFVGGLVIAMYLPIFKLGSVV